MSGAGSALRRGAGVVLAGLLLACAAPDGEPPAATHVLLVSIDSLRADHLGSYGHARETSPHIDALAREGTLVERATSSTSWTLPAHVALLTGLDDRVHGVTQARLALGPGPATLAERLAGAGFATGAVVSGPFLHPQYGLARGFDDYQNCMSFLGDHFEPRPDGAGRGGMFQRSHADVTSPCVVAKARAWLAAHARGPAFLFLHFWDVHYDYAPPEPYWRRFDPDYAGDFDASNHAQNPAIRPDMDPRDLRHLIARYDGEVAYTDEHVGEVLAALEALGLADRTLVAITSDHGDAFFEHGVAGHHLDLHAEAVRIPLVFRGPGVPRGLRIPGPAHITDVAPTLLDLLGHGPGARRSPGSGWSLRPAFRDPAQLRGRSVLSELVAKRHLIALESLDRKLLRVADRGTTWAYDLRLDPGERRPRRLDPAAAARVDAHLDALPEARATLPVGRLRRSLRDELRALGYLE